VPDGPVEDATEGEWNRNYLTLLLPAQTGEILKGSLVQIESASTLYLGEVQQIRGLTALVRVEHTVDRSKLALIEKIWG
jgi:hypothetical protein